MRIDTPEHSEAERSSEEDVAVIEASAALYSSSLTIVRTKKGLEGILQFIDFYRGHPNRFVQSRLMLGEILATAALTREESRGTHYREDFPRSDPAWGKRIVIFCGKRGFPVAGVLG